MNVSANAKSFDPPGATPDPFDVEALTAIEEALGQRVLDRLTRGPARSRPVAILRCERRRVAHLPDDAS